MGGWLLLCGAWTCRRRVYLSGSLSVLRVWIEVTSVHNTCPDFFIRDSTLDVS